MTTALVIAMTLAPWAFGVAMLYALLREPRSWRSAEHMILVGAGAYVGYIVLAGILFGLLHWGFSPLSWRLPLVGLGILAVCILVGSWHRRSDQARWTPAPPSMALINGGRIGNALMLMISIWLAGLALWVLWEVWHNPVMAWDAVEVWGLHTQHQLITALSDQPHILGRSFHPETVVMITMWSAYWSLWSEHAILIFGPWGIQYLGTLLVTLGLMLTVTGSRLLAMVLTAVVMSAPMIESHAAMGGYADLWVLGGVAAGVGVLIGLRSEHKTPMVWLTALALVLSVAALKNNSVVYSTIVLLGWGLSVLLTSRRAWLGYVMFAGMLAGLAYGLTWGMSVDIGPLSAAYSPEAGTVRLGSRASAIAQVSWIEIGHNLWQAWSMASSYGVIFTVALLALPVATIAALIRKDRAAMVLLSGAWGLIAFLMLAQWISEYFYFYATPSNDTGLTRFSHAVYWLVVVGLLTLVLNIRRLVSPT